MDGFSEVISTAFALDDARVDLARGQIVVTTQADVEESLVVAEVQIDLTPIVKDEDFAVLEGTHGARIAVQIGINLDCSDP